MGELDDSVARLAALPEPEPEPFIPTVEQLTAALVHAQGCSLMSYADDQDICTEKAVGNGCGCEEVAELILERLYGVRSR
jgi:hypothetical protein